MKNVGGASKPQFFVERNRITWEIPRLSLGRDRDSILSHDCHETTERIEQLISKVKETHCIMYAFAEDHETFAELRKSSERHAALTFTGFPKSRKFIVFV